MKRILFVIPSMRIGGAEKSLANLLNLIDLNEFNFNKAITEYNAIYELLSDRKMKILCRGQAKKSAGWMPWH